MERLNKTELKERLSGMTVVVDSKVYALYGNCFLEGTLVIPALESAKNLDTVEMICNHMLKRGLNRGDCVAAVGGGLTGDTVGFAASIYMRGIDWVFVPTTLLSLIDSSVGGKTGVNLNGKKNIIGSFHEPRQVIYCPEFLESLPQDEFQSAKAEIVKTASLDINTFELFNKNAHLDALIESCRAYKSELVKRDLFDKDCRRYLNFGHTVGHALELKYSLSHGAAVALGMRIEIFMASVTEQYLTDFIHNQTEELLKTVKINPQDASGITKNALSDKKCENGAITLCVPVSHSEVRVVHLTENEFLKKLEQYFYQK